MRYSYDIEGPTSWAFVQAMADACAEWERVCNVEFVYGPPSEVRHFTIHASNEYGNGAAVVNGNGMWVDPALEQTYSGWAAGTYSAFVPMHEIGHILGLYDIKDGSVDMRQSALSYDWYFDDTQYLHPGTPMPLDIAQVVSAYGPNLDTSGDHTVHKIRQTSGLETIYDAGGVGDILDMTGIVDTDSGIFLGEGLVDLTDHQVMLVGIEAIRLSKRVVDDVFLYHDGVDEIIYGLSANSKKTRSDDDLLWVIGGEEDPVRLKKSEVAELELGRGKFWWVDEHIVEWAGTAKALGLLMENAG